MYISQTKITCLKMLKVQQWNAKTIKKNHPSFHIKYGSVDISTKTKANLCSRLAAVIQFRVRALRRHHRSVFSAHLVRQNEDKSMQDDTVRRRLQVSTLEERAKTSGRTYIHPFTTAIMISNNFQLGCPQKHVCSAKEVSRKDARKPGRNARQQHDFSMPPVSI